MDIASSPTSNTHFDSALDYLDRFHRRHFAIEYLKTEVRILKTFAICARSWRWSKVLYSGGDDKGECERLGCTLSRIQHLVSTIPNRIHSAFRTPGRDIAEICVTTFQEEIEHLGTEIKDFYIIFAEDQSHNSQGDPDRDPRRLTDLIDSLLDVLLDEWLYKLKVHKGDLMFLKIFFSFATLQLQGGIVGRMQLIDLLLHVEFVVLNAARLIHILWLGIFDEQVREKMESEISRLLHKIKPADADPSVRQTYIRVLADSKLTRSSHTFTLEKNSHIVVAIFIDSFVGYLMELLNSCTSFVVSVRNQLKKLYQSVTFLKILSGEWQEKFNGLDDEMKDHIGVAVCDAGILIFSLSVNEMKAGLAKETDIAHFHLLRKVQFIVAKIYATKSSFPFSIPMTNELGSLDFLLENLKELAKCEADSIAVLKDQINTIQEDLSSLKSFLEKIVEQRNNNEKLQALWGRVMEVAYKAEFVIDSLQALQVGDKTDCSPLSLDTITEEIKFIKTEADEIYDSMRHEGQAQQVTKTFIHMPSQVCTPSLNEVQVGLNDEVQRIVGGLTRGSKRLDIVSIVGMPGVGKTTLANKIYNDPVIMCHFHIRAWCIVSQVYSRHKLLLEILANIDSDSSNQFLKMGEDDLAEKLYKHLKGKRYLIVLDDMWDIEAWNLIESSFPDDAKASRILFTSRFRNLSSQFKLNYWPYHLRTLTDEESWELLQSKLFGKEGCPPTLRAVAMQIAKACKGLPLTIVVVAGILASTKQYYWEKVAQSLSSSTVIETEHCMKTLELSYIHLPDHLKSCFLYFGAFQEDQNIPVRRLLRLWISEGFVQKTEAKSLEDAADEYLMDLVGRSLVLVTQERSLSGAKACRIHDLLHEFCVLKAKEESFLHYFHGYNEHFTSHRLCISSKEKIKKSRLIFPHLRSLHSSVDGSYSRVWDDYSFIFRISKLLRVLDIRGLIPNENFPLEIELLVHLRYLAIQCYLASIPSGIANLSRLETFIIEGKRKVELPNTIWGMKKLRHLCARSLYGYPPVGFVLPIDDLDSSADFCHLDTFTLAIDPSSQSMQQIMRKLPRIRRLKCGETESGKSTGNCNENLDLCFLSRLESLRLDGFRRIEFDFPLNLKKLTLSRYGHPWSKISTIGMLPKLQVLKLLSDAFVGETWEIKEGEFPQLRVLKLKNLKIVRWTAPFDNFPPLEKLILDSCYNLKEVPSCLGEIPTIKRIEMKGCQSSVVSLVKQIQEEQKDYGNDLEIVVVVRDLAWKEFDIYQEIGGKESLFSN